EAEVGAQRPSLAVDLVERAFDVRSDMVAHLPRHVADQGGEHRLLAIEVSVESAQRDLCPAGDSNDRAVMEAALPEFEQSGVENLAQRLFAARGPRRLALAGRRDCSPHGTIRYRRRAWLVH